jgi:hypothetical protein
MSQELYNSGNECKSMDQRLCGKFSAARSKSSADLEMLWVFCRSTDNMAWLLLSCSCTVRLNRRVLRRAVHEHLSKSPGRIAVDQQNTLLASFGVTWMREHAKLASLEANISLYSIAVLNRGCSGIPVIYCTLTSEAPSFRTVMTVVTSSPTMIWLS